MMYIRCYLIYMLLPQMNLEVDMVIPGPQPKKTKVSYEERLVEMREDIAKILSRMYKDNYVLISELCDEHLDRSGNLLGKVRHNAAILIED